MNKEFEKFLDEYEIAYVVYGHIEKEVEKKSARHTQTYSRTYMRSGRRQQSNSLGRRKNER